MSQNPAPQIPPDPASQFGREQPHLESGMGRLDNNMEATPAEQPDQMDAAVENAQGQNRQINAQDDPGDRAPASRAQPDHSMYEEEPLGEDLRPEDAQPGDRRRQPRTRGRGGTP